MPAKNSAYRSAPFAMSRLMGSTQIYKHDFLSHPKILKLPPIYYKSYVLALEASESEIGRVTILPLKYNESFSKSKSLVTPSNAL